MLERRRGDDVTQRLSIEPLSALPTAALVCLFGPWDRWWSVYITLIVIDYATGMLAGAATGTLDSDRARSGVIRKVGSIAAIAVAHQVDRFTGDDSLVRVVLAAFIASEAWSCLENLDDCGVPLPGALKERVKALRECNPRKRTRKRCGDDDQAAQ
jgi:toxin secretion/phage lysis holin